MPHRVAFLGFSEAERKALASHFRLAHHRSPAYEQVPTLTDADFLVADADHGPSVQLVQAIERLGETLFIGLEAPEGCRAWLPRPVQAPEVMRQLDMLAGKAPGDADATAPAAVPLTLRDPQPLSAPAAPLPAPPEPDLVAHEPPLPVTQPPVPEAEWTPKLSRPPRAPRARKTQRVPLMPATPRVLLVDDSAIALRFLEVRLSVWHLEIDRAATSQAAIALLAQHSYDIVFLDIDLGEGSEMDGLTLCQRIKHTPALLGAMVILVSAHHSELDRVRGALAGCDAYLAKPLDRRELQRLMDHQGVRAISGEGTAAP